MSPPSRARRAAVSLLPLALALTACADDHVPLGYRLDPGRRLEYRLQLRADITRALEGDTRQQEVEAEFRAAQEVLSPLPDGGARARMSLVPRSLRVDGEAVEVGPDQEFVVHLAPDGRVVEITEATGRPSDALAPVGIERLLPRLRPVLPGRPVTAGDTWRSHTSFADEDGTFSFDARSRLEQFGVTEGVRAALVRTTYVSPVDRRESFANAVADMEGRDVGAQEAWFALDGFLVRASGDSVGSYRVTFHPPGGQAGLAPVEGALEVRVHTEIALL